MGAWSHDSFGNDDAMDFIADLEEEGFAAIEEAFETILEVDEYLEAPEASFGLAAAEVVAALLGRPVSKLPEEVAGWVKGKKPPKKSLVEK